MALALAACVQPTSPPRPERPNLLIFVTDDQRADGTLGVMPNVRRWFQDEGTEFTHAFATTPLCCPSRASIFSGRYAHNHGVRHNYESHELDQDATMQAHLQDAGYLTGIAGKYLNQWGSERPPGHFDRFAIFLDGEYYDRQWNLDGEVATLPDYTNDIVRENALEFLSEFQDTDDEQPWFLYVATNAAHAPFTAEPKYSDAPVPPWRRTPAVTERDIADKPVFHEIRGRRRSIRARQLRTLMSADDLLGTVMQWLAENGELADTAAVFMSDNGMQWGEHGFTGKRQAYLPSTRIPLFLRLPGRTTGTSDARIAANIDVAPTVLDIAGVEPPAMDGLSLLGDDTRAELLLEHWHDSETRVSDWASLVSKRYQYVEFYDEGRTTATGYFDLRDDPYQLTNLLGDRDRSNDPPVGAIARRLARARNCTASTCP